MITRGHEITAVTAGSIADELGIEPGDRLIRINDTTVMDIFDYQYLVEDEEIVVLIQKKNGEEWELEIEKDEEEDLGLTFESSLMDDYRSCKNNCIFCFIDQMPKGMRDTLYFKDDDTRLSFLQGNYVTLTNLSDEDVDRIIRYHMSPINISFHTTNPKLRNMMLHNRFAGESLKKVDRLVKEGPHIELNGQIVLCKGINDKEELHRTIKDLTSYLPNLRSVSVVPVGLSKYRDGLYPLEPFTKEDAIEVLDEIHAWQETLYPQHGVHFIHASDEFYLLAQRSVPAEKTYDGYLQLENGVGMIRLLIEEFHATLADVKRHDDLLLESNHDAAQDASMPYPEVRTAFSAYAEEISVATGKLVYPFIKELMQELTDYCPGLKIHVHEITNEFFGEHITVTGLLTGRDIIAQLRDKPLGSRLLLPSNVLRSGENYLLDDVTIDEISDALHVPVTIIGTGPDASIMSILK
ncbi:MAG: DUF512 domain-containing protein [Lachnospiraceae bacterium]|nr:DUF512 domain-containing protein [Lachnospiraceae bacterium]